ncbi:glycosyltransferase family 2 protein [Paenibacillus sp. S-38]|uniref:glycosyltransferase family 2 protein n=1 Tax=Paenibacillus sp. S-38 TaxID=3416710 RepID=UPI003CE935B1
MNKDETRDVPTPVGVVLAVYDQSKDYIEECIESLEAQEFRDFKLVIVIDGANDSTTDAVYDASRRMTVPCQILCRFENLGLVHTLNEGFAELPDCEYLTWVSSDNRHEASFLGTLYESLRQAPEETVLAYSMFHYIDSEGRRTSDAPDSLEAMRKHMDRPKEHIYQSCYIGPSFLFKRSAYEAAGRYMPDFPRVEDYEFWIRLLQQGDSQFIPEPLMEYRVGGEHALSTRTPVEELQTTAMKASVYHRRKIGDQPKVTIVLYAHNQESLVPAAVDSVFGQTFTDFHLVLVDGGSRDETWSRMHHYQDPRIIPLRLDEGKGSSYAWNLGFAHALGDYVLEIGAEDVLPPDTLEMLIGRLEEEPAAWGFAYAKACHWLGGSEPGSPAAVIRSEQLHCPLFYRRSAFDLPSVIRYRRETGRQLHRYFQGSPSGKLVLDAQSAAERKPAGGRRKRKTAAARKGKQRRPPSRGRSKNRTPQTPLRRSAGKRGAPLAKSRASHRRPRRERAAA